MKKFPELPCTKHKCLLYPTCKYKKEIICELLTTYIINNKPIYTNGSNIYDTNLKDFYNHINKTLNNVGVIYEQDTISMDSKTKSCNRIM